MCKRIQIRIRKLKNGVLLIQPVFDLNQSVVTPQDRLRAIDGVVVAAFRMGDLMYSVLEGHPSAENGDMTVRIYDSATPDKDTVLFETSERDDGKFQYRATSELFGRNWTFEFLGTPIGWRWSGNIQSRSSFLLLVFCSLFS